MQYSMIIPSGTKTGFEKIMAGYHDLVDHGKREIYKIEA